MPKNIVAQKEQRYQKRRDKNYLEFQNKSFTAPHSLVWTPGWKTTVFAILMLNAMWMDSAEGAGNTSKSLKAPRKNKPDAAPQDAEIVSKMVNATHSPTLSSEAASSLLTQVINPLSDFLISFPAAIPAKASITRAKINEFATAIGRDNVTAVDQHLQEFPELTEHVIYEPLLPIHFAALTNRTQVMQYFIDKRHNITRENSDGYDALSMACSRGYSEVVRLLLQNGAYETHKETTRKNCIIQAAVYEQHNTLTLLNKMGYDIDDSSFPAPILTILTLPDPKERVDGLATLMAHGANPNKTAGGMYKGQSPLYVAAAHNFTEEVQLLLQHHANMYQATQEGILPVDRALWNGYYNIVEIFLRNHFNIYYVSKRNGGEMDFIDWIIHAQIDSPACKNIRQELKLTPHTANLIPLLNGRIHSSYSSFMFQQMRENFILLSFIATMVSASIYISRHGGLKGCSDFISQRSKQFYRHWYLIPKLHRIGKEISDPFNRSLKLTPLLGHLVAYTAEDTFFYLTFNNAQSNSVILEIKGKKQEIPVKDLLLRIATELFKWVGLVTVSHKRLEFNPLGHVFTAESLEQAAQNILSHYQATLLAKQKPSPSLFKPVENKSFTPIDQKQVWINAYNQQLKTLRDNVVEHFNRCVEPSIACFICDKEATHHIILKATSPFLFVKKFKVHSAILLALMAKELKRLGCILTVENNRLIIQSFNIEGDFSLDRVEKVSGKIIGALRSQEEKAPAQEVISTPSPSPPDSASTTPRTHSPITSVPLVTEKMKSEEESPREKKSDRVTVAYVPPDWKPSPLLSSVKPKKLPWERYPNHVHNKSREELATHIQHFRAQITEVLQSDHLTKTEDIELSLLCYIVGLCLALGEFDKDVVFTDFRTQISHAGFLIFISNEETFAVIKQSILTTANQFITNTPREGKQEDATLEFPTLRDVISTLNSDHSFTIDKIINLSDEDFCKNIFTTALPKIVKTTNLLCDATNPQPPALQPHLFAKIKTLLAIAGELYNEDRRSRFEALSKTNHPCGAYVINKEICKFFQNARTLHNKHHHEVEHHNAFVMKLGQMAVNIQKKFLIRDEPVQATSLNCVFS